MSMRDIMRTLSMGCGESLHFSRLVASNSTTRSTQNSWVKPPVKPKQTWGKKKK